MRYTSRLGLHREKQLINDKMDGDLKAASGRLLELNRTKQVPLQRTGAPDDQQKLLLRQEKRYG